MYDIQKTNTRAYSDPETVHHYERKLKLRSDEEWIVQNIFTKPKSSLLIIGCGAGRTVIPLAANKEKEFAITALDIAPPTVEACKKNLQSRSLTAYVDIGDAAELPASFTETFDYVFLPFHAINYISPVSSRFCAILEARRVLKPGGVLIFNTHNKFFYKYFLRFTRSKDKPYVKDKVPHSPGFVISYYAHPYMEWHSISKIFGGKSAMIWRGKIENKFPVWKNAIRRVFPVFFEKSIYYVCTK